MQKYDLGKCNLDLCYEILVALCSSCACNQFPARCLHRGLLALFRLRSTASAQIRWPSLSGIISHALRCHLFDSSIWCSNYDAYILKESDFPREGDGPCRSVVLNIIAHEENSIEESAFICRCSIARRPFNRAW